MIIFGDSNTVPYLLVDKERYFILNLYNCTNLGERLDKLWIPSIIIQACPTDSREFDNAYCNYLIGDDAAFQDFMEILMAVYYNDDVFILTDLQSPVVVSMCESIVKLIQQRYGYNCYIAHTIDDIMDIPESEMSEIGVQIFMQDKERYTYLSSDGRKLMQNREIVGEENDKYI